MIRLQKKACLVTIFYRDAPHGVRGKVGDSSELFDPVGTPAVLGLGLYCRSKLQVDLTDYF